MLLDDPRLDFASELIVHWTEIRGSRLVPPQEYIDPTEMMRSVPLITIAEISDPDTVRIELAECSLARRYGRDITHTNWFEFVPPEHKRMAERVRRLLISVPCGVYYKFRASSDDHEIIREGETLGLPLRNLSSESPDRSISLSRDIFFKGVADPATRARCKLKDLFVRFVDIGAGVPEAIE